MSNRRESIGRLGSRKQSSSGPPTQDFVSVAVLPPRLPPGVAPPTGLGPADAMGWDERLNWTHNEEIPDPSKKERKPSILKRAGLTTERKKRNEDLPPFTFRQVPYETWRKHYAKDAQGNYRGTHAPAEDCLLKPEDVSKWRLGEPRTKADLWTRGSEALPVYHEVKAEGDVPAYHDGGVPQYTDPSVPIATGAEPYLNERGSLSQEATTAAAAATTTTTYENADATERNGSNASALSAVSTRSSELDYTASTDPSAQVDPGRRLINGKTAEQIIAEQKEKNKNKPKGNMTWKERVKRGAEYAMMGSS